MIALTLTPTPNPNPGEPASVPMVACEHFHGGAGEVLRFTNLGAAVAGEVHHVSAPFESLPASVRALQKGSDLLVTFATGSVATMARNWAANVQRVGAAEPLRIGPTPSTSFHNLSQTVHDPSTSFHDPPTTLPRASTTLPRASTTLPRASTAFQVRPSTS